MAIDKIFNEANVDGIADNIFSAVNNSVSEVKAMQQRKAAENVQLVVESLKKIDTDIREKFDNVTDVIEKRVLSIKDGRDGISGSDGRNGKDGKPGRDAVNGKQGVSGTSGKDGLDGKDGVSVNDAHIDFDGSLIISLSSGKTLNVGEVVSQDVAEKIRVISTMSTNAAIAVKDEGTAITSGVKTLNFVGATVTASSSGDDVTINVSAGTGTVTSVAVSGGTTGLTTSGSPITTTGTITLGGTLAVASGGTGTATPSLVAGTNVTVTGTWPNQTVNSTASSSGTVTSVAATVPAFLSVTGSPITTTGTLAIGLSGTALPVANGGTGNATGTATINANLTGGVTSVGNAATVVTNANLTGDVTSSGNATTLTNAPVIAKVLTGYVSGAGTVAATDSILQAIQKLNGNDATNANLTGPITSVGNATSITAGAIVNADINASAGIVDTKLATISTALKVSNSATTAASANTASAIVARDVSGNFSAGTITAALTGTASGNLVSGGALGTPSSGTATNITGLPLTTGVTGVLPIANGGTNATTAAAALVSLGNRTSATGSEIIPAGTTAQRDTTPATGFLRYNSTIASFEGYSGTAWGSVGGDATGFGFKNRIINGDMRIDQRNAGASVTPTVDNTYTLDRWSTGLSQTSKFSVQQNAGSVTLPVGFSNYLGVTSLAATSLNAGDYFNLKYTIEGFNTSDLQFGTANAKTITLSFQVYSSLTGTFGGALQNGAQSRSYPFSYSIPVANTWTTINVTFAGDATGTWVGATNGKGLSIWFSLGSGSTYSGTAGAWASGGIFAPTGATSVVGTSGATFYITGVQLEKGSTATAFDYRDYGRELIMCQRYFWKWANDGGSTNFDLMLQAYSATSAFGKLFDFPVVMRLAPTALATGTFQPHNATGAPQAAFTSTAGFRVTTHSLATGDWSGSSGLVAGNATGLAVGTNAVITLTAEL